MSTKVDFVKRPRRRLARKRDGQLVAVVLVQGGGWSVKHISEVVPKVLAGLVKALGGPAR